MSFQQKAIVLVSVVMATDFEHKLSGADEFYKHVKFQANSLSASAWYYTFYFSIVFGSVAMTSYLTPF